MGNESTDSQILSQEHSTIELLARETQTAIATVQELFLAEYKKLSAHAHITLYVPVLTSNSVRAILESASARNLSVAGT